MRASTALGWRSISTRAVCSPRGGPTPLYRAGKWDRCRLNTARPAGDIRDSIGSLPPTHFGRPEFVTEHRGEVRRRAFQRQAGQTGGRGRVSARPGRAGVKGAATDCAAPGPCTATIGYGLSTISFLIGPSTERSSFFSRSGTLNLFSVSTRSPTNASKSAFEIPMPACAVRISRPV